MLILFVISLVMGQKCGYSIDANGKPIETEMEPTIMGEMTACSFMSNQPVCCVRDQDTSMDIDFDSLDATFGSDGGGCDICSANMKRFWCHYSCDPKQGSFLKITGYQNMTDPRDQTKTIEAQMVTLRIHPSIACEVYSTCKRTSFASQVSAMGSPGGFFTFQGEQGVSSSGQFIKIEFAEDNSLKMENIWNCNHTYSKTTEEDGKLHYWDDWGYEIKEPCGCNTCDESCTEDQILYKELGVFNGFEGYYVIIAWGWCLLAAIGMSIYRECMQKNEEVQEEDLLI